MTPSHRASQGTAGGVRAVRTTGIYCRPECSARPDPENVTQYAFPAAAEAAGYRACHRCRPYRQDGAPGAIGPDLVCRAVQMVLDGALDDRTEADLAARVGVSPRHLRRLFDEHVGVTPDGLARSRRAHFARRLLDDTDLPVADVAFAAGFGSVRQLQRACVDVFGGSPRELRSRRRSTDRLSADGGLDLRLGHRGPLDWQALLGWLAARAVAGVEVVDGDSYRRTVLVDDSPGVIELRRGGEDHLVLRAHLPYWKGLIHIVRAARRLAGLDVDVIAAAAHLGSHPLLAPLLDARPGLRAPGAWDPFELTVRAVIGQQVSVPAARTLTCRLVAQRGDLVDGLDSMGLTHTFPSAATMAQAPPPDIGLTGRRAETVHELARAVDSDRLELDPDIGAEQVGESLLAVRGLGEWTAQYVALRLGAPDAFPCGDVVLRDSAARLAGTERLDTRSMARLAEQWRPWRSTAATHLWNLPR